MDLTNIPDDSDIVPYSADPEAPPFGPAPERVTPLTAGPDWDYENNNMDKDLDTDDISTSGLESSDDFGPFSPAVSFSSFSSDPSYFASDPSDLPSSRPSSSSDETQTQGDYDQFGSPWQIAVLDCDWVWSAVDALGFAYNGKPSM